MKSVGEMNLMRSSAVAAADAIQHCIQLSHTGVHERLLATEFEYQVKLAGASRLAYPVVAGGGPDACTIHYSRNDKQVIEWSIFMTASQTNTLMRYTHLHLCCDATTLHVLQTQAFKYCEAVL